MTRKKTIEDCFRVSALKNGKCLSTRYFNSKRLLTWECEYKHQWNACYNQIQQGGWCPKCALINNTGQNHCQSLSIKECRALATKNKGRCVSVKYINSKKLLTWECEYKHQWEACYNKIHQGSWCPDCAGFKKKTIEDCFRLAKKMKGKFLRDAYINNRTKYKWQCNCGYKWEAAYDNIQRGQWCPKCSGNLRKTIDDCISIAINRGGLFLSSAYVNARTKYKWQCKFKHAWMATYADVSAGSWCQECRKNTIDDCRRIAKVKNGLFLRDAYTNSDAKYKWQCKFKHTWMARYKDINAGGWCPKCNIINRKNTIQDCHRIAKSNNGKCLSTVYVTRKFKYIWECKYYHQWKALYGDVQQGHWCPTCARGVNSSEEVTRRIFERLLDVEFISCRPDWLCGLELDGFNEEFKIAFEYDGRQHSEYVPLFHNNNPEEFKDQQNRDGKKDILCREHGIKLFRIPHTYNARDPEALEEYISDMLLTAGYGDDEIPPDLPVLDGSDKSGEVFLSDNDKPPIFVLDNLKPKPKPPKRSGIIKM